MRILLLLSLLTVTADLALAQGAATPPRPATPAPQRPATPAPAPAPATPPQTARPAQPARRPAAPASTRSGMAMTVTNMTGGTIARVRVEISGPTTRMGETDSGGQVNFPGLQVGTYRLRFSGADVITFEREVTLRAGQIADLDITLSAAPPPPSAPAAPTSQPASVSTTATGPVGQPRTLAVPELLEKEFVGNQPRRETLLSCSANTRTTMIQMNGPLPERVYENADSAYYVIGGEGTAVIAGTETVLATNAFVSVPRKTPHSFTRRGRRPLIVLAVLSGEPCEQAR